MNSDFKIFIFISFNFKSANAINVPKPFHTFRYELNYSDEYLQRWYAFKSQQMIEWVKKHLLLNTGNEMKKRKRCNPLHLNLKKLFSN
ncbi:MAG: hypothetical protein IPH77_14525 [Ignavibacteria bacterium]|nr:hypothetical protein [Ignavibacteria bacterium]